MPAWWYGRHGHATDPLFPPADAVIVAPPGATPVTTPVLLTIATLPPPLVHTKTWPGITAPVWSRAVAVNCIVPPTKSPTTDGVTAIVPD